MIFSTAAYAQRFRRGPYPFMKEKTRKYPQAIIQNILLVSLVLLLALNILIQSNPGKKTPARDSGFYTYIGDQILQGKLPYRDAWESKPPAIFYINAFGLWLGHGSRWGIWAVEMAFLMAAVYFSIQVMENLWGMWPAILGTLVWLLGLNNSMMGGNLTEEYPLPFHFTSFVLFLKLLENPKKRLLNFLLGLVFAIAFLFRPNNAATEAAVIFVILCPQIFQRKPRNFFFQLLWIALGMALPIAVTALYFWSQGLLRDLWEASILYNLTYSGTQLTTSSALTAGFHLLGIAARIALAGYLLLVLHIKERTRTKWFYLLLGLGWPVVIFLSDPAQRNYDHYFMNWLPFIGLLAGFAFQHLQNWFIPKLKGWKHQRASGLVLGLILGIVFFIINGNLYDLRKAANHLTGKSQGVDIRSPISIYVNEHTHSGEYVLFWGAYPGENFMSNRPTPSAVLFYPLYVKSEISTRLDDRFLNDLETNRPVLIVDMGDLETLSLDPVERQKRIAENVGWPYLPDNLGQVFAFIDQNYVSAGKVKGLNVYRLKGAQ